ncbi:MAG TPA: DUF459 domain-containing protein, partial [Ancylobacter sp.]
MRVRRPELWLKVLALSGTLLFSGGMAHAQSDWFRPPGNVGQPTSRPPQQQQQRYRQQPQRQQARPQPVQPLPQRESWSPFQPFINLFRSEPRRYVQPARP